MSLRVLTLLLVVCAYAFAGAPVVEMAPEMPPGIPSQSVLDRYLENTKTQAEKMKGVSMDVDISAEMPKLKKRGTLQALRTITRLGKITYDAIRFEGDNTIKKELIARYMSTEVEATDKTAPPITPEFYKFKYKGLVERDVERDSVQVHWFQVTPKKKLAGTFKGDIWLEKDTCLTLRESGRLVKNPSVFIKQFDFVRLYEIKEGISVPKETTGLVETRLWGRAEMNIHFSNFTFLNQAASGLSEGQFDKTPRE
ncbi:MAG: hypothetical protein HY820_07640 [Acidobacteria bacterium]|nr:hypothetical protein [Acidobacteriota bacterium]